MILFHRENKAESLSSLARGNAPRVGGMNLFHRENKAESLSSLARGNAPRSKRYKTQAPTGRNHFASRGGFFHSKFDSAPLGLATGFYGFRRALPYANDERASPCCARLMKEDAQ